mmetsp:Transcript_209/g.291  ORF Transcript_209/g.291 Transcript_209/m.291 type:complete len:250 (-) Transcript_209:138-887(-)
MATTYDAVCALEEEGFEPKREAIRKPASAAATIIPPTFPAFTSAATIRPADKTPTKIEETASAIGIPITKAIMAPVQAPVPGKGTPTKAASACQRFLPSTSELFFRALVRGLSRTRCTIGVLRARSNGTIGNILPKTQRARVLANGTPIQTPTGKAPRSSTTGIAAIAAIITKSGTPEACKAVATFSPKCGDASAAAFANGAINATAAPVPTPISVRRSRDCFFVGTESTVDSYFCADSWVIPNVLCCW